MCLSRLLKKKKKATHKELPTSHGHHRYLPAVQKTTFSTELNLITSSLSFCVIAYRKSLFSPKLHLQTHHFGLLQYGYLHRRTVEQYNIAVLQNIIIYTSLALFYNF